MDQTNLNNPKTPDDKVIPIKPKLPTRKSPQKRASLPKDPQRKVVIRRDGALKKKKKKEPFSYKYVKKKTGSFWANYWEIIVTILLAVIFAIYILPRFLQ
jgi:hypothetical protein